MANAIGACAFFGRPCSPAVLCKLFKHFGCGNLTKRRHALSIPRDSIAALFLWLAAPVLTRRWMRQLLVASARVCKGGGKYEWLGIRQRASPEWSWLTVRDAENVRQIGRDGLP